MTSKSISEMFTQRKKNQNKISMGTLAIISPLIVNQWVPLDFVFLTKFYFPVACALLAVLGILSLINWRCPKCNSYLGKRFWIKKCYKCGIRLIE